MSRKTVTRLADSAASVGYMKGWNDAHDAYKVRIAELEAQVAGLKTFEAKQAAMIRALQWRLSRAGLDTSIPQKSERESAS
jgi:hypothetical protein